MEKIALERRGHLEVDVERTEVNPFSLTISGGAAISICVIM
jgi:hypothetical protein